MTEDARMFVWDTATSKWVAAKTTQGVSGTVAVSNFPATQPVSGSVAVSNLPATQPVSGSVAVSNFPGNVNVNNFPATQPVSGTVAVSNLLATQPVSGTVAVNNFPASQAVTLAAAPVTAVTMAAPATPVAGNSGALSQHKLISAATTNATLIKAAASRIYSGYFINTSAAAKYIKFYNKATTPVPGTDTPVFTVFIAPTSMANINFGTYGKSLTLGLGIAITANIADLDNTAVAANDVFSYIDYL